MRQSRTLLEPASSVRLKQAFELGYQAQAHVAHENSQQLAGRHTMTADRVFRTERR